MMQYIKGFIAVIAAFLAPLSPIMISATVLALLDITTGVMASLKEKRPITSRRFVSKFMHVIAFFCIIVGFSASAPMLAAIGLPTEWMVGYTAAMYALYEMFSILENGNRLGIPFISKIVTKLKGVTDQDDKIGK